MGGRKDRRVYFAVGSPGGPRGSAWVAIASPTKDDVYVSPLGALAGVEKYSFHQSRVCRRAFIEAPSTMDDRVTAKWTRKLTPPAGSGLGTRVLCVCYPTDFLSSWSVPPERPLTWIDPAPSEGATFVELIYVREPRERLEAVFANRGERDLVGYLKLPGGEAFAIIRSHGPWENRDLELTATHESDALLCSAKDPRGTGRPLRVQVRLRDGSDGAMVLIEMGAYVVPGTRLGYSVPAPSTGPVA